MKFFVCFSFKLNQQLNNQQLILNKKNLNSDKKSMKVLKQRLMDQILQLEQLFHSRYLTPQLLNELISSYVQAIQGFDEVHLPMRKYFLNKIQFILSRPQIDSMLQRTSQNSPMMDIMRQTVRMTTCNTNLQEGLSQQMLMQVIQQDQKRKKQSIKKQSTKKQSTKSSSTIPKRQLSNENKSTSNEQSNIKNEKNNQSLQQQKLTDRHLKIQMQMKVMRQIQQNMKNLQQQFNQQDKKTTHVNKRINALVQQQNNTLQNRKAMRGKNKKKTRKSIDQKVMNQTRDDDNKIQKKQLIQAQKEIQQAVVRMTIRMTQRVTNSKGMFGLINARSLAINKTDDNPTQQQKGRIKVKPVHELHQEQQDLSNIFVKKQSEQKKLDQAQFQTQNRLTSGGQGKGRITTRRIDRQQIQDEQMLI